MEELRSILISQRRFFQGGHTLDLRSRRSSLKGLLKAIRQAEPDILQALHQDLRKSAAEAMATEVCLVDAELRHVMRHLKDWASAEKLETPLISFPAKVWSQPEPLGQCLVMSPWNYPYLLTLLPVISAIAAGNCVVVKPSEHAPATARVIERLLSQAFPAQHLKVILGDADIASMLTREKWDHLFFTGSTELGRKVMAAAAPHLTPVTLELGGKCPALLLEDADFAAAGKRIAWGKLLNSGQTCIAPDYVLVPRQHRDAFLNAYIQSVRSFYGDDARLSPDYGRIIHHRHWQRLKGLLEGQVILHGGRSDEEDLYLEPTVVAVQDYSPALMREEIFGPILPVLCYDDLEVTLQELSRQPKPLAAYLFTQDRAREAAVLPRLAAGSIGINDVIVQTVGAIPFGGVGDSGMGRYHGKAGFETFSNRKIIMRRPASLELPMRYPPYRTPVDVLRKVFRVLLHS
jgi:aldehyde dehydrogenase (NAD+)